MKQETDYTNESFSFTKPSHSKGGTATLSERGFTEENFTSAGETALGSESVECTEEKFSSLNFILEENLESRYSSRIDHPVRKKSDIHESSEEDVVEIAKRFPDIVIFGESFRVEQFEDGSFLVSHPKWSLSGIGSNLFEAEREVYKSAKTASEIYLKESVRNLNYEALRMRKYLIELMPIHA